MSFSTFTLRLALVSVVASVPMLAGEASGGISKKSPFELRGGPATPVAAANETVEFAGVSSIGKKTDLIFYDKTAKKSHWIAEGETKEGIAVVEYDADREEAVVKINGVQKTLALRKPSKPTGHTARVVAPAPSFNTPPVPLPAPIGPQAGNANVILPAAPGNTMASPAPAMPVPPPPPTGSPAEIQAKQETEARMLVSDLLEIGMAQRRAYEEAQRKAAEGKSQNPPNPNAEPAQVPPSP